MQALYEGSPTFELVEITMSEPVTLENGDKLTTGAKEYVIKGVPQVVENRWINVQKVLGVMVV